MVLQCEWAQVQVILLTNDGNGFGFGILGSRNSGAVVRNIFPGGAAEKDGNLQNGDHLLAVGEVRLWGMGAEQVAAILRQAGQESIRLVIARPIDPSVPNYLVNSVIVPTKALNNPMELESTLQSSLLQQQSAAAAAAVAAASNGYPFEPSASALAAAVSSQSNPITDITSLQPIGPLTSASASDFVQLPKTKTFNCSSDESSFPSRSSSSAPMMHNVPLPLSNGPTHNVHTVITTNGIVTPIGESPLVLLNSPPPLTEEENPSSLPPTHSSSTTTICEVDVHFQEVRNINIADGKAPYIPTTDASENVARLTQTSTAESSVEEEMDVVTTSTAGVTGVAIASENVVTHKSVVQTVDERPSQLRCHGRSSSFKQIPFTKVESDIDDPKEKVGNSRRSKLTRKLSVPAYVVDSRHNVNSKCEDYRSVFCSEEKRAKKTGSWTRNEKLRRSSFKSRPSSANPNSASLCMVLPEKEEHKISLLKGNSGLGITVAGYVCEKEDLCGIFVKSIIPGSIADKCGEIMVNDQIVKVDDVALNGFNNQKAVEMLKQTGTVVNLTIVRYLRGLKFEELKQGIYQANIVKPTSPVSVSPVSTTTQDKVSCESEVRCQRLVRADPSKQKKHSSQKGSPKLAKTSSSLDISKERNNSTRHNSIPRIRSEKHTSMPSSISVPLIASPCRSKEILKQLVETDPVVPKSQIPVDEKQLKILARWENRVDEDNNVLIAFINKTCDLSGLGLSLEGTVDVEGGKEVRPHHYIRSILPNGPVALEGTLKSGDELLEVNGKCLKGLFHDEVVTILKHLPASVSLVCCRKRAGGPGPVRGTIVDNMETGKSEKAFASRKILSGSLQSLLDAKGPEFLMKAKSEVSLLCNNSNSISFDITNEKSSNSILSLTPTAAITSQTKSKSLEQLNCGAMWSSFVEEVVLVKKEKGLGFSILDYQDPLKTNETVIVIRSLIPGGVAYQDRRILPGDRLVYVNSIRLDNASLDMAVQALKGAAFGPVKLGIAKPLPESVHRQLENEKEEGNTHSSPAYVSDCNTQEESNISDLRTDPITPNLSIGSRSSNTNGKSSSSSSSTIDDENEEIQHGGLKASRGILEPTLNIPILPHFPKYSIIVNKKPNESFGVQVETLAFELYGTVVRKIDADGAVARDGRLRPGDLILFLNHESMWRVTSSQAKIVLRRAEFVTTGIPVIFIPEEHLALPSSEDSTETGDDEGSENDPGFISEEESLKLSDIREESQLDDNLSSSHSFFEPTEEIRTDFTVKSASNAASVAIRRFPSDLLESSVDPDFTSNSNSSIQPDSAAKDLLLCTISQETSSSSTKMVRVYNPPQGVADRTESTDKKMRSSPPSTSSYNNNNAYSRCWSDPRTVAVYKQPGKGLGISIVGGKIDSSQENGASFSGEELNGIFIKNVIRESAAGQTGQLFPGDRIIEISGVLISTSDQFVAVQAIKCSEDPVRFVVQSLLQPKQLSSSEKKTETTLLPAVVSTTSVHSSSSPSK